MNPKQQAAEAAMQYIADGMVVGLGTGSTADYFLQALAEALRSGRLRDIHGVPTSTMSERRARELHIPLATLADYPACDVTVDGADEIDPRLDLIKGLGGAMLREKIIAQNSRSLVIIADDGKTVPRLGTRAPLPVEVTQFANEAAEAYLRTLGCEPALRRAPGGTAIVTDNGNLIYDCRFPQGIGDPVQLDRALSTRAGIVETGLFLGLATVALVADGRSVRTLRRQSM
jgi:ribose 5-phosphate isomerase A